MSFKKSIGTHNVKRFATEIVSNVYTILDTEISVITINIIL